MTLETYVFLSLAFVVAGIALQIAKTAKKRNSDLAYELYEAKQETKKLERQMDDMQTNQARINAEFIRCTNEIHSAMVKHAQVV